MDKEQNCRDCDVILTTNNTSPSFLKTSQRNCRSCFAKRRRDRYKKSRDKVIDLLDKCCEICGQKEEYLLNIDHIDGGGNQEKKTIKGYQFLNYILGMNDAKEKYRLLCYNCNYSKGFHGISGVEIEKLF